MMSSDEEFLDPSVSQSTPIIKRKRTVAPRAKAKRLVRPRGKTSDSSDASILEDSDDESLGLPDDSDDEILATSSSRSRAKAKSSKGKVKAKAKTKGKAKNAKNKRVSSSGGGTGNLKVVKKSKGETGDDEEAAPATNLHYRKPGQKFHIPSNGDGIRVYYESLYEQNCNDYLAIKYMIEYGCLELGSPALEEAYEKYCYLKQEGAFKRLGGTRHEHDQTLLEVHARFDSKRETVATDNIKKETPIS